MASLSPNAAAILARARAGQRLPARAEQRMTSALLQRVARGQEPLPGIDANPVSLPKLSWFTRLLGRAAGRVVVSVGSVVLAGAIGGLIVRQPPPAQPRRAAGVLRDAPPRGAETTQVPVETVPASSATTPAPAPSKKPRKPGSVRAARHADPPLPSSASSQAQQSVAPAPLRAATTLEAELQLLRQAHEELNAGRAERALSVLAEHAARFPQGELAEARELASMLALNGAGRERDACAKARRFVVAHPSSPFLGKVQAICPAAAKRER